MNGCSSSNFFFANPICPTGQQYQICAFGCQEFVKTPTLLHVYYHVFYGVFVHTTVQYITWEG